MPKKPPEPDSLHEINVESARRVMLAWWGEDPDADSLGGMGWNPLGMVGTMGSIVADLMHMADDAGVDWADVMLAASGCYAAEVEAGDG